MPMIRKVGRFYIIERHSAFGFDVHNESTGYTVTGIRYDDGRVAYDYPEKLPRYVKDAVARFMAKPFTPPPAPPIVPATGVVWGARGWRLVGGTPIVEVPARHVIEERIANAHKD